MSDEHIITSGAGGSGGGGPQISVSGENLGDKIIDAIFGDKELEAGG